MIPAFDVGLGIDNAALAGASNCCNDRVDYDHSPFVQDFTAGNHVS